MEMETDEEDEDGQIGRDEQDDERLRRLSGGHTKSSTSEPTSKADLIGIQLKRDEIAKYFRAPWFKDYVKGMRSFFSRLESLSLTGGRDVGEVSHRQ